MNAQSAPLGLTVEVEQFYRQVLRSAPATVEEHTEALGWDVREAQRVLRVLERMRLCRLLADGQVRVEDPRASVGRLLDHEEADLDERRRRLLGLRESLESFEADYRRGLQLAGPPAPVWEQVSPAEAPSVVEHLYRTSTGPVLQVSSRIDVGPAHDEGVRRHWESEAAAGRVLRSIFPLSVLTDPYWAAFAEERAGRGEHQRYLADDALRIDFGLFGDTAVLVEERTESSYLLMRPERVIDAYGMLFEELWRRAEPVVSQDTSAQEVKLLELLSLGFKDEAIARQLGLGLRTVRRRIAALMEEHGADTRFQLGMAVTRHGLVE